MDVPTTPFVTDCVVIVLRVKLRAKLLQESTDDMMFDSCAQTLFEGGVYKSAGAFFTAFEASLRDMPLTLKYFNRLRHYERRIPTKDTDPEARRLIEAINRDERLDPDSRPPDFDYVRFPQRSAAFIRDAVDAPSYSCNS